MYGPTRWLHYLAPEPSNTHIRYGDTVRKVKNTPRRVAVSDKRNPFHTNLARHPYPMSDTFLNRPDTIQAISDPHTGKKMPMRCSISKMYDYAYRASMGYIFGHGETKPRFGDVEVNCFIV